MYRELGRAPGEPVIEFDQRLSGQSSRMPMTITDLGWYEHSQYDGDFLQVVGVAGNPGPYPVATPTVSVLQYDSADRLVDRSNVAVVIGGVLYPGDICPFFAEQPPITNGQLRVDPRTEWFQVVADAPVIPRMPIPISVEASMNYWETCFVQYRANMWNPTPYTLDNCRATFLQYMGTPEVPSAAVFADLGRGVPAPRSTYRFVRTFTFDPSYASRWYAWAIGEKAEPTRTIESRVAGADRYATAIAASQEGFPDGAPCAVVVSGQGFADALSASALAGASHGPLLLTPVDETPAGLAGELARLGVERVVLVGGEAAVGPGTEAELRASVAETCVVQRIAGADRYATSALVGSAVASASGGPPGEAFVVRGDTFPDALAVAPIAATLSMPVLLVRPASVPPEVLAASEALGTTGLYVVGGVGAVSDGVVTSFGLPTTRVAGDDRYETSALVAVTALDNGWTDLRVVGLASGCNYPDALAAGPVLATQGGALLLSDPAVLSFASGAAVMVTADLIGELEVFGGTSAITKFTADTAHYLCL